MVVVALTLVAPNSFSFEVSDDEFLKDRDRFWKLCRQAWFVLAALNWIASKGQSHTWPCQDMMLFVPEPEEAA